MEKKELTTIDCDTIQDLRMRGYWWEAKQMVKAYQNSLVKNRKEAKRLDYNIYRRMRNLWKKRKISSKV